MPNYVYLVSDGKKIKVSRVRPKNIKVRNGEWKEHGFSFEIGEEITVYTDDPWIGTVGVYDVSKPSHILKLAETMRKHSLALAARRIKSQVYDTFGEQAVLEVGSYRWALDSYKQRKHQWTKTGKLLFETEEVVNGVCFRNE